MKKFLLYSIAILILISCCSSFSYATGLDVMDKKENIISQAEQMEPIENENELNYVAVKGINIDFIIKSGKAVCTCKVIPKKMSSITSITGKFKIINSSGKTIKSYKQTMTMSNGAFYFSKNYTLSTKGTYHLKATLTCYKKGVKQETISLSSNKATY